jgi:hypothetical protein
MSTDPDNSKDTMLDEYDFSEGEVGNYAERFKAGTNLVLLLEPDVIMQEFGSPRVVAQQKAVWWRITIP